jgi:hypothetical protein
MFWTPFRVDALEESERVEAASLAEELEDMEVLKGILALSGDLLFEEVFDVILTWSSERISETGVRRMFCFVCGGFYSSGMLLRWYCEDCFDSVLCQGTDCIQGSLIWMSDEFRMKDDTRHSLYTCSTA